MISDIILTVIFMIPLYGFLIWTFICPEDSILLGKRWMYQEEPEISPNVIRYIKFASIFTMIAAPIILISMFLESHFFGIALMGYILVLAIGAIFIFTADSKS